MNVFTVKTLLPDVKLSTIFQGVMPFVIANLVAVGLLIAWPDIALVALRWF